MDGRDLAGGNEILEAVAEVLGRLAEELAFAEPGADTGLLPVNALLLDLEQLPAGTLPASLAAGLRLARGWVDATLDGSGRFSAETLRCLDEWHGWMTDCVMNEAANLDPPPLPAGLAGTVEPSTPAVAPLPIEPEPIAAGPAASAPIAAGPTAPGPTDPAPDEAAPATPVMVLKLPGEAEMLAEFHSESLELLRSIERAVLTLGATPGNTEAVNAIFRAFHTFKGSAGFLQLDALRDFAHELESLLDGVRSGEVPVTRPVIDAILAGADVLGECTQPVGAQVAGVNPGTPIPVRSGPVLVQVRAALRGEVAAPAMLAVAAPAAETPTSPPPSAMPGPSGAATTTTVANGTSSTGASAGRTASSPGAVADNFVRLDAAKLDALVNLVGELMVAQAFVVESPEVRGADSLTLAHAVRKLSRITRELQNNAMSLRMVPVAGLFRKMTRLVRDLAASQGKQVRLVLQGEETELDRQLVEKMGDPLIHMIRNAVDHGIESPEVREAGGKNPVGTITLAAFHRHGGIVLRVADDGRGLDAARLQAKAVEKGLIDPAASLSREEALELIFLPGLSTAAKVTDLSGRGVGMDVVRGQIEALRGHVDIASSPGHGAEFTIRLPLTLALIDGLLVGVGGDRYILPALAVRETFRPAPGSVSRVHEQGEMVAVRGEQLPVLRLSRMLQRPCRVEVPEEGIIVVVESGPATRAVLVDEFLGKQEVVIKNMGDTFSGQSLVAGGAILGDGTVGLILDIDSLVRATRTALPAVAAGRRVDA